MPVHLQFSRIGLNNIADPFFGTMAAYFLVRAWRNPAAAVRNFAWAGVMIGLTQYWYEGGRLLFPVLFVAWLGLSGFIAWPIMQQQRQVRHYLRGVAVAVIAAVLVAAPIYITLLGMERPLAQRMDSAGLGLSAFMNVGDAWVLLEHVVRRMSQSYLIHVSIPEEAMYYAGDHPLLSPYVVPFFIAGVFYTLWLIMGKDALTRPTRYQTLLQAGAMLLLLWVLGTWAGNMLMARSRIAARYVVEFPALALFAALGIDVIVRVLLGQWPRGQQLALVVLIGGLTFIQVDYFFTPYMARFNEQFTEEQTGRSMNIDDAVYRSMSFPDSTTVHIVDRIPFLVSDVNNALRFYRGDRDEATITTTAVIPTEFNTSYLQDVDITRSHAFFVAPNDTNSITLLQTTFDNVIGPFSTEHSPAQTTQMLMYYVPMQTYPGASTLQR